MRSASIWRAAGAAVLGVALIAAPASQAKTGDWTMGGQNTSNTRSNAAESVIGVGNVSRLQVQWKFPTAGDVSATPAVEDGTVYVPDFAGNLYALDRATGEQRWTASIPAFTGIPGDHARATPAISGNTLIIGDQAGKAGSPNGYLMGIDKRTGTLLWKTSVGGGFPIITQSATVKDGVAYVGVASFEEALIGFIPGFQLSFRGSMMAVDVATGRILWTTMMAPEGFTGASVWGSSPALDPARNQVYVATGNNYSAPPSVTECIADAATPEVAAACVPSGNMFDSIVALNMKTGAVNWAFQALPSDAWNVACGIPGIVPPAATGCPEGAGPDYDFGQAPALYRAKSGSGMTLDYVGAGQKSGQYWALDPSTGAVRWVTQAGPGGLAGGLQWGSATDGQRVYVANSNSGFQPWALTNGTTVNYGGWSGLAAGTGAIRWQTPNPAGAQAMGPVSAANGVVYGCSLDPDGHMYAMKAASGQILWDFPSGASCNGGAAISNGMVFWGTGYDAFSTAPDNDQAVYAFAIPKG